MQANGTFQVELTPQQDSEFPAGRMLIDKTYAGDMVGSGIGQMISKRTEGGTAVYAAVEEFTGSLQGKSGSFTLIHQGRMSAEGMSLDVIILEGSGTGDLAQASGSMRIDQDEDGHRYELSFELSQA